MIVRYLILVGIFPQLLPAVVWGQRPCTDFPGYRTEALLGPVRSIVTAFYQVNEEGEHVRNGLSFRREYSSRQCLVRSGYDVYSENEWRRSCTTTYDSLTLRITAKECNDEAAFQRWHYDPVMGQEGRYARVLIDGVAEDELQHEVLQYENGVVVYKEAFVDPYFLVSYYDKWRRVTRMETYNTDRALIFSTERKFVEGDLSEEIRYTGANAQIDQRLVYQHKVRQRIMMENKYQSDGALTSSTTYYYSEIGLLMRIEKDYASTGKEDETTLYLYDFDQWGNWIERRKWLNDRVLTVEKREINYY